MSQSRSNKDGAKRRGWIGAMQGDRLSVALNLLRNLLRILPGQTGSMTEEELIKELRVALGVLRSVGPDVRISADDARLIYEISAGLNAEWPDLRTEYEVPVMSLVARAKCLELEGEKNLDSAQSQPSPCPVAGHDRNVKLKLLFKSALAMLQSCIGDPPNRGDVEAYSAWDQRLRTGITLLISLPEGLELDLYEVSAASDIMKRLLSLPEEAWLPHVKDLIQFVSRIDAANPLNALASMAVRASEN